MKKGKKISTYILVALASSVALGGICTIMFINTFSKVPVLVAARDISPYAEPISIDDFKTIEIAKGDIENFKSFVANKDSLVGKVAISQVYEGQPVKDIQFVNPEESAGIQSIVGDENNRGLYLNLTSTNSLLGDMKIGGMYDFYIVTERDKPLSSNPENKETVVVPLQYSYLVKKTIVSDGGVDVFMEFPKEESERYILLKNMISKNMATLMATMPSTLHEEYKGKIVGYDDFFGAMMSKNNYFTSISKSSNKKDTDITVENDINNSKDTQETNKENKEDKKDDNAN